VHPIGAVNWTCYTQALLGASLLIAACATPPPAGSPNDAIVLGSETATTVGATRQGATEPTGGVLPNALTPCSEENPTGCTAGPPKPTKLDAAKRYSVAINTDDPILGNPTAAVKMVVFSDFECPYCARLELVLAKVRARFGERVCLVWKDLPLPNHTFALSAAVLAREAFARFGGARFWTVHDELFMHQSKLSDEWLADFARQQSLTWPPDARYVPRIQADVHLADQLAINATPTVFINGRPVVGARDEGAYADLIVEELEHAPKHGL
jgi:protein-disulfide isomerase